MSVREKSDKMQKAREQFNDKQREFNEYTENFAANISEKQDIDGFITARESLIESMELMNKSFAVRSDEFDDDIAELTADVESKAAVFDEVANQFDSYAVDFESDVQNKQDITHLLNAINDLNAEMETTQYTFNSYTEAFADDVVAMQDISALRSAITDLQEAFRDVTGAFNSYSAAFEADIEEIRESAVAKRNTFTQTSEAFVMYERSFYEEDVQSVLDAINEFQETIETFRAQFATTEAEFSAYVQEFYGADTTGDESTSGQDENAEPTAQNESDDAVSVDISDDDSASESPPANKGSTEDDLNSADDTSGPTEDSESTEDTTTETGYGTDYTVEPVSDGLVQCLVCSEYYQAITEPHLQTHDMSIQDYRDEYGEDVPLRPDDNQ